MFEAPFRGPLPTNRRSRAPSRSPCRSCRTVIYRTQRVSGSSGRRRTRRGHDAVVPDDSLPGRGRDELARVREPPVVQAEPVAVLGPAEQVKLHGRTGAAARKNLPRRGRDVCACTRLGRARSQYSLYERLDGGDGRIDLTARTALVAVGDLLAIGLVVGVGALPADQSVLTGTVCRDADAGDIGGSSSQGLEDCTPPPRPRRFGRLSVALSWDGYWPLGSHRDFGQRRCSPAVRRDFALVAGSSGARCCCSGAA